MAPAGTPDSIVSRSREPQSNTTKSDRPSIHTPPRLTATYMPGNTDRSSIHTPPRLAATYMPRSTPISMPTDKSRHPTTVARAVSPLSPTLTPPSRETIRNAINLHTFQSVSLSPFEPYVQQLIDSAIDLDVNNCVPTPNNSHSIPMLPTFESVNKVLLPPIPHCPGPHITCTTHPVRRPRISSEFEEKHPKEALIYNVVRDKGAPNFRGARLPLSHKLNINESRWQAFKYYDVQLPDFLEFGFPTGFVGADIPALGLDNHSSAVKNPQHIANYLTTELSHHAIMGPFKQPPFQDWFRTNPMLTRPKRDSDKLRVILDLSFPQGQC